MRKVKVKNCEIVPPKVSSGAIDTPANMPRAHLVNVTVGKRNSGKTTAVINMIEKMGFDYSIVVSPTMKSNKDLMQRLKVEHTFEDTDDCSIVDSIKKIVEDEAKDLERYREELKRYHKMMKAMKSGGVLRDDDLMMFFGNGDFMKPEHRWNGEKPRIAVLFDDCLGSQLYSKPRKLNALSTYSRHVGQLSEGGSVGVSLFFLIQSFKCQVGGLNKCIRNQCTNLILFKTKDANELKDLAESVAGEVDEDTFKKVYDLAIGDGSGHPFLFIDLHKKDTHPSMFRKCFDEFIVLSEK